ncbi:MAG: hypothetical protein BGO52_03635 [Sphingobacteriales bacterium 44-61]|nr:MAG: hypothetical protein BGO52_03635 [Sphingobacteriales bacterium 44-61]
MTGRNKLVAIKLFHTAVFSKNINRLKTQKLSYENEYKKIFKNINRLHFFNSKKLIFFGG